MLTLMLADDTRVFVEFHSLRKSVHDTCCLVFMWYVWIAQ